MYDQGTEAEEGLSETKTDTTFHAQQWEGNCEKSSGGIAVP